MLNTINLFGTNYVEDNVVHSRGLTNELDI